ncbi:G0/G1 switch protein 2 [Tautogolabrus adspersus]
METIREIIPFAKEMLNERPSRRTLQIFMLGSALAMFGAVGRLVQIVLLPFVELEGTVEDTPAAGLMLERKKKEKKQMLKSHPTLVEPEVVDELETEWVQDKAKYLMTPVRRSSVNRVHAS